MLRRVAEQGLLVSEYPPGVRPGATRFLTRTAWSPPCPGATVEVEAGLRSGAANTASWAEALGRPGLRLSRPGDVVGLGGVPRADQKRRAFLVTRVEEVVEVVGAAQAGWPPRARPERRWTD